MPELSPLPPKLSKSPLFTLRIWQEELGNGEIEWRGKLQDVTSSDSHYFRDWYTLIESLQALLKAYFGPRSVP